MRHSFERSAQLRTLVKIERSANVEESLIPQQYKIPGVSFCVVVLSQNIPVSVKENIPVCGIGKLQPG